MPTSGYEQFDLHSLRLVSQATKTFPGAQQTIWNGGLIQGINNFLKTQSLCQKTPGKTKTMLHYFIGT